MNQYALTTISPWPAAIAVDPFLPMGFLTVVRSFDPRIAATGGVNPHPHSAVAAALAEAMERRHFYAEVPWRERKSLEEAVGDEACGSFARAFHQTAASPLATDDILSHRFQVTPAHSVFEGAGRDVPRVCISMFDASLGRDVAFLPSRDTTGNAVHTSAEGAKRAALYEFLERQALLAFWYTGSMRARLHLAESVISSGMRRVFDVLQSSGELFLCDITPHDLPGSVILALYRSDSAHERVRYSAGVAYHRNTVDAAEKAVAELWQCYLYLYTFEIEGHDVAVIDDHYHRNFIRANDQSTIEIFAPGIQSLALLEVTDRLSSELEESSETEHAQLSWIRKYTEHLYLYFATEVVGRHAHVFCKALSPDFFLNMNTAQGINRSNAFSDTFTLIRPASIGRLLPFP